MPLSLPEFFGELPLCKFFFAFAILLTGGGLTLSSPDLENFRTLAACKRASLLETLIHASR